jgi:hypothetical protein
MKPGSPRARKRQAKKEEPANRLLDLVQRLSQAVGYAALTAS